MQGNGVNYCKVIASSLAQFDQNFRRPLTQKWDWVENQLRWLLPLLLITFSNTKVSLLKIFRHWKLVWYITLSGWMMYMKLEFLKKQFQPIFSARNIM